VSHEVQPAELAMNDKPKRRWFQFSLWSLFVVVTLFSIRDLLWLTVVVVLVGGCLVGWLTDHRRQAEHVKKIDAENQRLQEYLSDLERLTPKFGGER
jgi:hypothetical protein